jgi:DNA mismatch endonuclease (patch repair protein)
MSERMSKSILDRMENGFTAFRKWKDTKPELLMFDGLLRSGYMVSKQIRVYGVGLVDFYLPEENVMIECDGDFWHCNPDDFDENFYNKSNGKFAWQIWEQDKIRTKKLKQLGYKIFRFWEKDIISDLDRCLAKVVK